MEFALFMGTCALRTAVYTPFSGQSDVQGEHKVCVQSSRAAWHLKMLSRNDVRMYHSTLRKIPKKELISLHHVGSLKSSTNLELFESISFPLYIMGIYVSIKPQEYKILAKLEKQTRLAMKDTRLGKNDRGILVQFLVDTRDMFLL